MVLLEWQRISTTSTTLGTIRWENPISPSVANFPIGHFPYWDVRHTTFSPLFYNENYISNISNILSHPGFANICEGNVLFGGSSKCRFPQCLLILLLRSVLLRILVGGASQICSSAYSDHMDWYESSGSLCSLCRDSCKL